MRRISLPPAPPSVALLLGASLLFSSTAAASSTGVLRGPNAEDLPASGCAACHVGGHTPTVEIIVGDGDSVALGATVPVRVRVQDANDGARGGFNLLTSGGLLGLHPAQAVRLATTGENAGREATHSSPGGLSDDPDIIEFVVDWTAPEGVGESVEFSAYGVSISPAGGTTSSGMGQASVTVTTRCPRYWPDEDGDGYGTGDDFVETCEAPPEGRAPRGGDCDDADPAIHPGAIELCNNIDDNCNGEVDEPRLDPPPMCENPGEICWDGVCQDAPELDAGTDAGSDGGPDRPDAGGRPDGGEYVVPESEIILATGGCSATGIGALPLALGIFGALILRTRRRD